MAEIKKLKRDNYNIIATQDSMSNYSASIAHARVYTHLITHTHTYSVQAVACIASYLL